jgi:hypothetical protein
MTEDEVNLKVKEWLKSHSFRYKGVCKTKGKSINNNQAKHRGFGQVAVPDGIGNGRSVLLDHQGFSDQTKELFWIEAKGSGVNFSELLEGFVRTVYAIYHGGGNGYLAVPHAEYQRLLEQRDFLRAVAESVNGKGQMGLLDVENENEVVFD